MILTLMALVTSASAHDRPVAVFPGANRVVIESRERGLVTLHTCVLPTDRSEKPTECSPLGLPMPDDAAGDRAFNEALDRASAHLRERLRHANVLYSEFQGAVLFATLVNVWSDAHGIKRRLGRGMNWAELGKSLKLVAPFALFAGGMFTVGNLFVHAHSRTYRRALAAFSRPKPDETHDGLIVFNDFFGVYDELAQVLDAATRPPTASADLANPPPR